MPKTDSYFQVVGDLEGLAAAVDENMALLPDVQAERTELAQGLARLKTLKERQKSFTAARQATTQELRKAMADSRQVAEKIRDAVKFKIGRRNEKLVQFNIAPLRKRTRKPAQPPGPSDVKI
jgi:hypothetical protein